MDFFNKLREPVVLKEDSNAVKQMEQLESCLKTAPEGMKARIEQDKKLLSYGIKGEEAIMFELKNSHMPMYILHDVFFNEGELKTQIDYIVITRKLVLIIECKNLYGNITIDNQGNFTRKVQVGNHSYKEGIYSPITQNQRHLDMIREKRRMSKGFLGKIAFDMSFEDSYKSIVVIANPKSVIEMKYASKDIKSKIVKVDGLNSYIKKLNDESTNPAMSDKQMKELAEFFLENSVPNEMDYTAKYRLADSDGVVLEKKNKIMQEAVSEEEKSQNDISVIEELPVYKALKAYRYEQSRMENVKAYYIFNNAQLEEIILKKPKSIEELKNIKGFGDVKCMKYGNDIVKILKEDAKE